jgi:hypothetical protein
LPGGSRRVPNFSEQNHRQGACDDECASSPVFSYVSPPAKGDGPATHPRDAEPNIRLAGETNHSPVEVCESELTEYRFGTGNIRHLFCRRCGIKPIGRGRPPQFAFVAINVACLDDLSPAELAALPVKYENGRENDYESSPAEARYL